MRSAALAFCVLSCAALPAAAGARTTTVAISTGGARAPVLHVRVPIRPQTPEAIAAAQSAAGPSAAAITVGAALPIAPLPDGFLGLSIEYPAVPAYAAAGARFDQLLANLTPDQRPVIRVGGDSTDHAFVPVAGEHNEGLWEPLNRAFMNHLSELARGTDGRMVMGLNLEANQRRVPLAEARAFRADLGGRLSALELGNEPELYSAFPWYHFDGQPAHYSRPASWSPAGLLAELTPLLPGLRGTRLWGPSLTATSTWWSSLDAFTTAIPALSTVTSHAYPTNCYAARSSTHWPTVANLLAASSSTGLALQAAPEISAAHAAHRGFRIDELNTVSCIGTMAIPGLASALWATEAGFALAAGGVDGINVNTSPAARTPVVSFPAHSTRVATSTTAGCCSPGAPRREPDWRPSA